MCHQRTHHDIHRLLRPIQHSIAGHPRYAHFQRRSLGCRPPRIRVQVNSREPDSNSSPPSPAGNLPQQVAAATSHIDNVHRLMHSTRQSPEPRQRRTIAQQPTVDLLQTAQAVTEILIATVAVHQLWQLTRGGPSSEVVFQTRPHECTSSPRSAPPFQPPTPAPAHTLAPA